MFGIVLAVLVGPHHVFGLSLSLVIVFFATVPTCQLLSVIFGLFGFLTWLVAVFVARLYIVEPLHTLQMSLPLRAALFTTVLVLLVGTGLLKLQRRQGA